MYYSKIAIFLLLSLSFRSHAQKQSLSWLPKLGVSYGRTIYQGDATSYQLGSFVRTGGNFGQIQYSQLLNQRFAGNINLSLGQIKGDESKETGFRQYRRYKFTTTYAMLSGTSQLFLLRNKTSWRRFNINKLHNEINANNRISTNLYVEAGMGIMLAGTKKDWSRMDRSQSYYNGYYNDLYLDSMNNSTITIVTIPIGTGVNLNFRTFSIDVKALYHICLSDNLDGIKYTALSKRYDSFATIAIGILIPSEIRFGKNGR